MIQITDRRPAVTLNFQPEGNPNLPADETRTDGDGLSLYDLDRFLTDIRDEPEWRLLADRCADYYDGNQLTDEVLADFRKWNLPPLVINLIQPTINTVLGMEAKTRTDWEVTFDDEENEDVAAAMNKKINEAERLSNADRAISDAYGGQIKAGLHWVEVGYASNPFAYRYRVRAVHRREIWYDWRTRDIDEWRYLVRKQRFDADRLAFAFPDFTELINAACEGGRNWQLWADRLTQNTGLGQFMDVERALTFDEQDWVDTTRRQIDVYEVWYRKYTRGYVARLPGGVVVEVDQQNPRHMMAIAAGVMQPTLATYPKLRQSLFIGPQRVFDRPTYLPHRKIPYVPLFGFREDLTGAPYGLVRSMLSPQDEINARRSKAMSLMNSRRVITDADALALAHNTHEDVAEEAGRSDAYIVLDPMRKNGDSGFRVEDNADLAQGQAAILESSKKEIHEVSGVFPPMAGDQSGGLSGLAINSLVEQGTQTLAEINDNYSWARREVGEHMLELVKADNLHPHTEVVGEGKAKKSINLNAQAWDGDLGQNTVQNNVATARLKLILQDVPSTPAWRQQQAAQLAEITKSLPPQLQAFVVPFYMEATDIRDRKKIASLLRRQLGIPEPGAEDQQQPQIPPEMQAQMEQLSQEAQASKEQLAQAVQKISEMQLAAKSRADEVAAREADSQRKAAVAMDANDVKREQIAMNEAHALADLERSEYPKGGGAGNADALQGAIEEAIATMREGFGEMHDRIGALEKGQQTPPAAPPPAPAAAPAPQPAPAQQQAPIVIHNHVYPSKAKGKTVTMDTPQGPMTARIAPDEEEPPGTPPDAAQE